ncbi:hypothetical protein [Bradyrhizobium tunisiense]|uniref:hypothetical protein n=1 Tax=Bradyrhizobium tunisiense TaxID=3278709 RepID=UPI0035D65F7A
MGTETTARTNWSAWLRIFGFVSLAAGITAIVASRSLGVSQLRGRLSVPPLYDDVSYFLDAIRWMNAVGDRSIAASSWTLLHDHAPFSTMVAITGLRCFPAASSGLISSTLYWSLHFCSGSSGWRGGGPCSRSRPA